MNISVKDFSKKKLNLIRQFFDLEKKLNNWIIIKNEQQKTNLDKKRYLPVTM